MNIKQKEILDALNKEDENILFKKYGYGFCYLDPKTQKPVYESDIMKKEERGYKLREKLLREFRRLKK